MKASETQVGPCKLRCHNYCSGSFLLALCLWVSVFLSYPKVLLLRKGFLLLPGTLSKNPRTGLENRTKKYTTQRPFRGLVASPFHLTCEETDEA